MIFKSKHFLLLNKLTYNYKKLFIILKKKNIYSNLNRNFYKKIIKKIFLLKNLNFYGYNFFLIVKKKYDDNKYFKFKKYYNNIFLLEILILFKKFKNFLKF